MLLGSGGCAVDTYKATIPSLDNECASSLAEVPANALAYLPDEAKLPKPVEFAELARCLQVSATEKKPVALYRLDGVSVPAKLKVSVILSAGGTLAATVRLLDAKFAVLQSFRFDQFTRRGSEYSLVVFLNDASRHPTYLMLMPDAAKIGKSDESLDATTATILVPIGLGFFVYSQGGERTQERPFLSGGKVVVIASSQSTAFSED